MDFEDSLEVLPLHHHYEKYSEACCELINSEWKRSHSARMISLKKSCDAFPTSLVMVHKHTEVVGHSKLTLIPSIPDACFVESEGLDEVITIEKPDEAKNPCLDLEAIVIDKCYRGRGWGKCLMIATEEYARNWGIQEMYLSAMDSIPEFYGKLGYVACEPVSIYGGPVSSPCPSPGPPTPLYIVYKHKRVLKTFMKKPLYDMEL